MSIYTYQIHAKSVPVRLSIRALFGYDDLHIEGLCQCHSRIASLNNVSSCMLADFSTLKMEAIRSYETPVHARPTRLHNLENDIFHLQRREDVKSYITICKFHSMHW
jgi:hypothetical protein